MMDRQALLRAWKDYYQTTYPAIDLRSMAMNERAEALVRRMRALACFKQTIYKGFCKRELEYALGMAVGVHKQLLWGVTSFARGGYNKKGGGRISLLPSARRLRPVD